MSNSAKCMSSGSKMNKMSQNACYLTVFDIKNVFVSCTKQIGLPVLIRFGYQIFLKNNLPMLTTNVNKTWTQPFAWRTQDLINIGSS